MTGASQVLKLARPALTVIAVEPESAALLWGNDRNLHKVQGWTPDCIPAILEKSVAGQIEQISDDEAIATSKRLVLKEGFLRYFRRGAPWLLHCVLQKMRLPIAFFCDASRYRRTLFVVATF